MDIMQKKGKREKTKKLPVIAIFESIHVHTYALNATKAILCILGAILK
jgi:hypothetical protein